MSEEIEGKALEEKEVDAVVTQDEVATNNATSKTPYILLLLFVLLFSGAFVYGYKQIVTLEHKLTETSSIEARVLADVDDRINASTAASNTVDSEHRKKLDELETGQEMLTNIVNQPAEQQIHINEDYALAEVEHLLIIASYNLQLDHDATTALAAMEAADARLKGLRDPMVLSVREQLIADMNELRSINQADLSGLGLFLSDLINRVDQLPLKENVVVEKNSEEIDEVKETTSDDDKFISQIKHFFMLIWEEIRKLFYYSNDENISIALLLPDEIYFLRANLKLELANARFAVFNRDTDNLHASIGHIQAWLNEYFDLSDAATQNIHDSLLRMKDLELDFPRMDISSSLESVRALIRSQEENNSKSE